jgi:hypothetical protein
MRASIGAKATGSPTLPFLRSTAVPGILTHGSRGECQVPVSLGVTVAGVPWNFSATPCEVTAAPLPDMDGDAIRAFLATAMPVVAEG